MRVWPCCVLKLASLDTLTEANLLAAMSCYAHFLEEAKQDLQGAQMLFTRAVALDPEHGTCLANRARCDLNSLCGHSAGSGTVVVRELKQPAGHDSLTC